ncbi:hypothetical protein ONE63_003946 [Megalurothrips usitatus]|uniref:NAD-dependent epimerase/dehydratase domain-containing protein n=1 Tax=Megalurothrips usitatus TaxID=439358 RepID=A0AAV7XAL3_9NEOP|nr:hypothetical protein ONE63_003946 [Megalurothrips usitatus]
MATANSSSSKPCVIVLGGCGFIGRNFVTYVIENDLVSHVRVVDKVPPQTAWLNSHHKKIFEDPRVEFRSANLIIPSSCQGAFATEELKWDYVVNCACETKPGQTDPVYKEGIVKLSLNVAGEAAKHNVKMFVELSSGHMASSDKAPHNEDSTSDPWTSVARYKLTVEKELGEIAGLNFCVLRPAIVYGIGDRQGLAPRLIIGAVYKHLNEVMKLLWTADLHLNTVHVKDVCRAIWLLASRDDSKGKIFNVVDDGDSTQGLISTLISDIFGISHDYYGQALSMMCKADMSSVVEEGNDKHMAPWAEACCSSGVENTPLTPFMDQELLYNKHLYLDGSRLKNLGFSLEVPMLTAQHLLEIVHDYADMNLFPRYLIGA